MGDIRTERRCLEASINTGRDGQTACKPAPTLTGRMLYFYADDWKIESEA